MSEKLIEVTMTYEREDGSRYRRTITDEQAAKWKQLADGACVMAQVHGMNPDWRSVQWTEEELESERR